MYALLVNKKNEDPPIMCDIDEISTNLWGSSVNDMLIIVIEDEDLLVPRVLLSEDLISSSPDCSAVQSRIITKIYEIKNP